MSAKTRQALLDAAIQVFSKNPGAPIDVVAETAGLGRATLYRYFPSRDALMRELVLQSYEEMAAAVKPLEDEELTASEYLLGILEAIIPLGDRFHFLVNEESFAQDPKVRSLRESDDQAWQNLISGLKAEGFIDFNVSPYWAVSVIEGLIYAAWESVRSGYVARRDAPLLAHRTLLSGLSADPIFPEG